MAKFEESEDQTLWTPDDLARWAKVSRSWVYQRAAAGEIPCLKVGGLLRFDPKTVKQFFLTGGTPERKVILVAQKAAREGR